jgi:ribosomal protein L37E
MADTILVTCPDCQKQIKAPTEFQGKKIRCRSCGAVIQVPGGAPAPASKAPASKAPAKKPAAAATIPLAEDKPKEKAPIRFDDEDDGPAIYTPTTLELAARCPHCAKEMESPEARLCLHCGYNTVTRTRTAQKVTYDITPMDYFLHLLPGVLAVIAIGIFIGIDIWVFRKAPGWFKEWDIEEYVKPGIMTLWVCIFSALAGWKLGRFAFRRLIINYKPTEVEVKK